MKNKLINILLCTIVVSSVAIVGCGSTNKLNDKYLTNESRTVCIEDKDNTLNAIKAVIVDNSTNEMFVDGFFIEDKDLITEPQINEVYYFNNSIYIQTNNKAMFRFQLNDENKIETYIKYNLEG